VVFTGDLSYATRKCIRLIDKRFPGVAWLILIHTPQGSLASTLKAQWRNLRRDGWRRIRDIGYTLRDRIRAATSTPTPPGAPGTEFSFEELIKLPNLKILSYTSINSPAAVRSVTAFNPDLGLSLAAPILKKRIFDIPVLGTLNLHKGRVPEYRGMPPAFWELWNGEVSVGCTVHWVEERLDAGAVAMSSQIAREKYSTTKGLQLRLDELGNELVINAIVSINQGETVRTPQRPGGAIHRKPTLKQTAELNRRLSGICKPGGGTTKRALKDLAKMAGFSFGTLALKHFAAPRVTVVLYHRVSDNARDNLTTGIEQFDRQMKLLRHHFQIISLRELLQMDGLRRSCKPIVCVTFDDGYLDNYENAYPILQRNNVPAAFFVSTGLIGTDRQFPHDVRRGNQPIPMMKWEHLIEMHNAGFVIGSHTVNHVDCAATEEELVVRELVDSRNEIRSRLGVEDVAFAYPYGGKGNMTEQRLALVKEAGYIGCLSAYGGTNVGHIDRFNIVRRGIHWEFSDKSFLWAALGLT
jgi:peptidoglycan/xylan/chitin deacetylase (PgdA/CDA1 family)